MKDKVAIVLAHPDDAELRCYGTICKYLDDGKECVLLIASSGEHGISVKEEQGTNDLLEKELREKETLLAFEGLPMSVHFLHQKDGYMEYGRNLIHAIEKELFDIQPDTIITHYPDLYGVDHQDHAAIGKAVLNCATRISTVKKILLCDPLKTVRSHFVPNYFVDITNYFGRKMKALQCQKSQDGRFYLEESFHKTKGLYYAANLSYEEARNNHYFEAYELYICYE